MPDRPVRRQQNLVAVAEATPRQTTTRRLNPLDNGEKNQKIPPLARVFFALQQKRWRRR